MIVKIIGVTTCAVSFFYTAYVLCNLTHFLSNHNGKPEASVPEKDEISSVAWSTLLDLSLLSIFMLQHSLMASDTVKYLFCKLRLEYLDRSVYNAISAGALHLLIDWWQPIPWLTLWRVDTASNTTAWLIFSAFHVLAWSIVYSGCLMMDASELAGLKQVSYKITGQRSPMEMKSRDLLRYYAHMRHPSFTGFLIILWIHPLMTLDRLLLALVLTVYMALMWTIDQDDYNYHANVIRRKQSGQF